MIDGGWRPLAWLLERYPALEQAWQPRPRISYVPQLSEADCGLASLAMVLSLHGRHTTIDELRQLLVVQAGAGVNAKVLLDAARALGLRGQGVTIDIDDLPHLPAGTILHWQFNHYVVFERADRRGIRIVDPAVGACFVPMADVRASLTGVALTFQPTDELLRVAPPRNDAWSVLSRLLCVPLWPRILITSMVLQVLALTAPSLIVLVVDRVVPMADHELLLVAIAGLALIAPFYYLALLVRGHLLLSLRRRVDVQLATSFMDRLVSLPFQYFQERTSGDLIARYGSTAAIQNTISSAALTILIDGTMVVLFLAMLLVTQPIMGLLVIAFAMVEVLVVAVPYRAQRERANQGLRIAGQALGAASEILHGAETLKLLGAEHAAVRRWTGRLAESIRVDLERAQVSVTQEATLGSLRFAAPVAVLLLGAHFVVSGALELGTMLSAVALGTGFLAPLSSLTTTVLSHSNLESHLLRVNEVLAAPPEQSVTVPGRALALRGRITVDDVWFRYGPLTPWVLKGVSLDVHPGQSVALVGASGCGKSTLTRLMLALAQPERGTVSFDGEDLRTLNFTSVRTQVGVVPQQAFLFHQSVRENIAAGNTAMTLDEIEAAAKAACIHDEILALPQGYDTVLADGGASLSGGQRQRVALARALARKPVILILDEATSALDVVSERTVQENLDRIGCARIVVAHRLSTIRNADQIAVFSDGQIVERGTHDELMRLDGTYARLVRTSPEAA